MQEGDIGAGLEHQMVQSAAITRGKTRQRRCKLASFMFDLTNVGLTHFGVIHARLALQVGIRDFGVCELKSHIFVESQMSSSC